MKCPILSVYFSRAPLPSIIVISKTPHGVPRRVLEGFGKILLKHVIWKCRRMLKVLSTSCQDTLSVVKQWKPGLLWLDLWYLQWPKLLLRFSCGCEVFKASLFVALKLHQKLLNLLLFLVKARIDSSTRLLMMSEMNQQAQTSLGWGREVHTQTSRCCDYINLIFSGSWATQLQKMLDKVFQMKALLVATVVTVRFVTVQPLCSRHPTKIRGSSSLKHTY